MNDGIALLALAATLCESEADHTATSQTNTLGLVLSLSPTRDWPSLYRIVGARCSRGIAIDAKGVKLSSIPTQVSSVKVVWP